MSAFIPNSREKRLGLAVATAGVTRDYILRYTQGAPGVEAYLKTPDACEKHSQAAIAVAEALAVAPSWLHHGEPSAAAHRLVLAMQLYEMTERNVDGKPVVEIPLAEYLELKARAASVPGPRLYHR